MKHTPRILVAFTARRFLLVNAALVVAIKLLIPWGGLGLAMITEQLKPIDTGAIIAQTNAARTTAQLALLVRNEKLDTAAEEKLNDMEREGYFAHVSPDGRLPWDFIRAQGYSFRTAGENLAKGFTDAPAVVAAWMLSSAHRANIVSSLYTDIGVAEKRFIFEGLPTTFVVQLFGSRMANTTAAATPSPLPVKPKIAKGSAAQQVQAVSTAPKSPTVAKPIKIVAPVAPGTAEISRHAGVALQLYLLAILGVLLLALTVVEIRRPATLALLGNGALLALAFVLPSIPMVTRWIF